MTLFAPDFDVFEQNHQTPSHSGQTRTTFLTSVQHCPTLSLTPPITIVNGEEMDMKIDDRTPNDDWLVPLETLRPGDLFRSRHHPDSAPVMVLKRDWWDDTDLSCVEVVYLHNGMRTTFSRKALVYPLDGVLVVHGIVRTEQPSAAHEGPEPEPGLDGWIEWSGGGRPVTADTVVEYVLRIEYEEGTAHVSRAGALRWDHKGSVGDIMLYRVVDEEG